MRKVVGFFALRIYSSTKVQVICYQIFVERAKVNSETAPLTLIWCLDINDNCNFKVQCEKKNGSKILSLSSFLKELLLKTTKPYDFEDND